MRIATGVILIVLGLAVVQFSGIMVWHPSGGIDVEDLFSFRWISNIGGRMRGDGGMFIGLGIIGLVMIAGGVWRCVKGKKPAQTET